MGGEPWFYFVPYQADINRALQALRKREFDAGRYNPVTPFPEFPVEADAPAPGAQHATIEEAIEDADADGTRSILDIERVSDDPDYGAITPLSEANLIELFWTISSSSSGSKGSVSFEHQISTVASCGIKLAPGVAADALLQSCDREAGKLE